MRSAVDKGDGLQLSQVTSVKGLKNFKKTYVSRFSAKGGEEEKDLLVVVRDILLDVPPAIRHHQGALTAFSNLVEVLKQKKDDLEVFEEALQDAGLKLTQLILALKADGPVRYI
eukprot:GHVL01014418.1.p1 GENE.GHVL01014418.1~~GHVL01014418.1.p1  ORF type:complete len:114 (-),score=22.87 GHVL01014418.1:103-444(-)